MTKLTLDIDNVGLLARQHRRHHRFRYGTTRRSGILRRLVALLIAIEALYVLGLAVLFSRMSASFLAFENEATGLWWGWISKVTGGVERSALALRLSW